MRRAARDVYSAIGYDLMYPDRIAQVEEGLFSQTMAFEDISYQSAREESQRAIFSGWCQLFDYFGADSCVQLTVVNRPIPAEEIGTKRFFPTDDPQTAAYAEEYNRILNDKMREGVSNLVRERYLTFAVGAPSVDAAVPRLARMRGDAEQTLAKMRSSSRTLSGAERIGVLNGLLRPGKPNLFSWDAGRRERRAHDEGLRVPLLPRLQARRQRLPASNPATRGARSSCSAGSAASCRTAASPTSSTAGPPRDHPPRPGHGQVEGGRLREEADLMHGQEITDEQMGRSRRVRLQILPSGAQILEGGGGGPARPSPEQNQRLYVYTGLVYTYAPTREGLDEQVMQIVSTARRNSIEADALDYRQREGLNSILPLGHNHVEVSRMMTTAQVAIQMPFATQELSHEGGGYYGQNKQSSNLVLCNRKRLCEPLWASSPASPDREVVLRQARDREHHPRVPEDEIIVLDPAGEYSPWSRRTAGSAYGSPRRGHAPQPVRPLRRRTPVALRPDGLQDRRLPGVVQRDHGRGGPGAPGGRQVHHQPLRRAGIPRRGREGRTPPSGTSTAS